MTAGVYLLIRFRPLLKASEIIKFLLLTAILTTLIARTRALYECDLKKVVALSTLSQLGIIVFTLAIGLPLLAFFHLLTHATFKALLFLCRGKIIHEIGDRQDIRSIGSLLLTLPLTRALFNLANLALCGFPFLAGFYSKDLLIEVSLSGGLTFFIIPILRLIVGLSSAYSIRLTIFRFLTSPSARPIIRVVEEDPLTKASYTMLGILATTRGVVISWLVFPSPDLISLPLQLKLFAIFSTLTGVILGVYKRMKLTLEVRGKINDIIINI